MIPVNLFVNKGVGVTEIKAKFLDFGFWPSSASARSFVSTYHYSGKCPPSTYYFMASYLGYPVGACCFRKPSLPSISNAYGVDMELARLVMLDEAGKNSESRFIGYCLRWLKKNTNTKKIISFADPDVGHYGTIYKASNFTFLGKEKGHGTRSICVDGEWMHSKTAYDRWGASGKNLENVLPGASIIVKVNEKKLVYTYDLKQR